MSWLSHSVMSEEGFEIRTELATEIIALGCTFCFEALCSLIFYFKELVQFKQLSATIYKTNFVYSRANL